MRRSGQQLRLNTTMTHAFTFGIEEEYFLVDAQTKMVVHDVPAGFRITPGMPVTADIKVGERTVLGYLLGLMLPIAREAMREP